MLCSEPRQRGRPSPAPKEGGGFRPPPSVVSLVLALNKAHVLALNTAHVLPTRRMYWLNKAHVLHLNTEIYQVFTANTKEAAFGRLHEGGVVPKQTLACCGRHQHQPKVMKCCSKTDFGISPKVIVMK